MKKRYLIAEWCVNRGQTKEAPAYLSGCLNYYVNYPLKDIDPERCYKTEKGAIRAAEKGMDVRYRFGWRNEVVEVPQDAFSVGVKM